MDAKQLATALAGIDERRQLLSLAQRRLLSAHAELEQTTGRWYLGVIVAEMAAIYSFAFMLVFLGKWLM